MSKIDYSSTVFYEVFIQSFADGNGDNIGDIAGLESRLDYLESLGIDVILLMPIHPSPSYHKYDVVDYFGVHEDYGTIDTFKSFVNTAHARGFSVLLDLVIHHSSALHPWFRKAIEQPESSYNSYYIWSSYDAIADDISKKETEADSDNWVQWHRAEEVDENHSYYQAYFWEGMPDFNFDNTRLREEVYKIGEFWLEEVGVDGFRLDAAKHLYDDDRVRDTVAFWEEFRRKMKVVSPDVFLVGEVWAEMDWAAPFAKGFSSLFNFHLSYVMLESVRRGSLIVPSLSLLIEDQFREFYTHSRGFISANFLSNHDQNRTGSVLGGQKKLMKQACALMLTIPGVPVIYYGEELGMLGVKPDEYIREPFLWGTDSDQTGQTSWIKARHSTPETVDPVEKQWSDPDSMLNHYKKWIQLRKQYPSLSKGDMRELEVSNDRLVAFSRTYRGESIGVLHNLSDKNIPVHLSSLGGFHQMIWSEKNSCMKGDILIVGFRESVLFKIYNH